MHSFSSSDMQKTWQDRVAWDMQVQPCLTLGNTPETCTGRHNKALSSGSKGFSQFTTHKATCCSPRLYSTGSPPPRNIGSVSDRASPQQSQPVSSEARLSGWCGVRGRGKIRSSICHAPALLFRHAHANAVSCCGITGYLLSLRAFSREDEMTMESCDIPKHGHGVRWRKGLAPQLRRSFPLDPEERQSLWHCRDGRQTIL